MLGSELKLKQVGITVFGNVDKFVDVRAWNIDEESQESAVRRLGAVGKVVRPTPDGAARDIGPWTYTNFTSTYTFKGGPSSIKAVASSAGADFVILLTPITDNFGDPFFRTNQSTAGYGVYQRRGGGSVVFADLGILLLDGKTGELLAKRRSFTSAQRADDLWIDIENVRPSISVLGQEKEVYRGVINAAVNQGLGYIGVAPR